MFVSQFFSITYYILQENFLKKYDINPFQLVGFEGLSGVTIYTILLIIFQNIKCNDWNYDLKTGICFGSDDPETKRDWYIEDTLFAFEQMRDSLALLLVYIFYT